jgi:hypothetical protein
MLFRTTGHCKQDWRLDPGGLLLTVASTRATPSAKKAHLSWCFHSRLQGSSEGTKTGGAFHREDVPPLPALGTLKKSHCAGFQSPSLVSPLPQDRVANRPGQWRCQGLPLLSVPTVSSQCGQGKKIQHWRLPHRVTHTHTNTHTHTHTPGTPSGSVVPPLRDLPLPAAHTSPQPLPFLSPQISTAATQRLFNQNAVSTYSITT